MFATILASKPARWAIGIAAGIAAVVLTIASIYRAGRQHGSAVVTAAVQDATIKAQERVDAAAADYRASGAADRLRDGRF